MVYQHKIGILKTNLQKHVSRLPAFTAAFLFLLSVVATGAGPLLNRAFAASNGSLNTENFNTVDGNYKGISVGFNAVNFSVVNSVVVTLTRADNTEVVKTANQGVFDLISNKSTPVQLTTPFVIQEGTFTEASDTQYWDPAPASWNENTVPTSVEIAVTDENGTKTVNNSVFSQGDPSWPTYESLLPATAVTNQANNQTFDTLQEALNDQDTNDGDTLVLNENITTSEQVTISRPITINGAGHTVSPTFTKTTNSNNAVIGIIGTNSVSINSLVIEGTQGIQLHGVNIYESTNVLLNNVSTNNNDHSGVSINSSTVTLNNISTSGNGWHAINADQRTNQPTNLTINGTSNHGETAPTPHIFVDDNSKQVTVTDTNGQYEVTTVPYDGAEADVYFLDLGPDPNNQNVLRMSGNLYRDVALNDCDNLSECKNSRTNEKLAGWEVRLYKEDGANSWQQVATTTTNNSGEYSFAAQQEAGVYHVCEVEQLGWTQAKQTWTGSGYKVDTPNQSGDSSEGPYCVTTTYDDTSDRSSTSQIGNVLNDPNGANQLNLSGYVFNNANGDRDQDSGEAKLSNWKLRLYKQDSSGLWSQLQEVSTNAANGDNYKFSTLKNAGIYHICEVQKTGWQQVKQNWSGTPFHIVTPNESGKTDEGAYCATTTFDDSSDRSSKKYFGNQDSGKPTANVVSPENGSLLGGSFAVAGTASDDQTDISEVKYTVTQINAIGGTYVANVTDGIADGTSNWSFDVAGLTDGFYRLKVQAFDTAGNFKYDYHDVQVDSTAPEIAITSVSEDPIEGEVTIEGTASDSGSGLRDLRISFRPLDEAGKVSKPVKTFTTTTDSNGEWGLTIDTAQYPELVDGNYRIVARANDKTGTGYTDSNTSAASEDVTIDNSTSNGGGENSQEVNTTTTNNTISNFNNIGVINNNLQNATTGNASVLGNTTSGSATSGDAGNTNSQSTTLSVNNGDGTEEEDGVVLGAQTEDDNSGFEVAGINGFWLLGGSALGIGALWALLAARRSRIEY